MFGDLKNKVAQEKEALTKRMNDCYVRSLSPDGDIQIIVNGNQEIMDMTISDEIYEDKEQLEDELLVTLNRAMEKSKQMYEFELQQVMKSAMPSIPGMDGLFD